LPRDLRNSDEQLWGNSLSAVNATNVADAFDETIQSGAV